MESASFRVPWAPLHILPLGDVQFAGEGHHSVSLEALREYIARGMEYEAQGHTIFFLGMADMIDFASPSNRAKLNAAGLYDTAIDVIDQAALHLNNELVRLALTPTIGRWAGLIAGHHFAKLANGLTSDQMLCKTLKAPFLGDCAIVKFDFQDAQRRQVEFQIWAHHGVGSSSTGYYPVAKLEKTSAKWEGVHCFLMGHACRQATETENKIAASWSRGKLKLTHRKVFLVGTGGYSLSYVLGSQQGQVPQAGYAEKAMMGPVALGRRSST